MLISRSTVRMLAGVTALVFSGYVLALVYVANNDGLMATLSGAWPILPLLMAANLTGFLLRYVRWYWLLARTGHATPFWEGLLAYFAGFALTATPGKVGELIRIRYFAHLGVPPERVIACFIFERVFDLLVLLSFATVLVGQITGLSAAAMFVALIIGAVAIAIRFPGLRELAAELLSKIGLTRVARLFGRLMEGVALTASLLTPANCLIAAALGCAAWGTQALANSHAFQQLGISASSPALFAVGPASLLIGAASMIPGGFGTTETSLALMLMALGAPLEIAVLGAIASRVASVWLAVALGGIALVVGELRIQHRHDAVEAADARDIGGRGNSIRSIDPPRAMNDGGQ